jgi:hypothetical protein
MRTIEEELLPPSAIVHNHREASRGGDDKLLKLFMGMTAPYPSSRHIIKVVDALDGEGNVAIAFDEGQIAPVIHDLRKINNAD